MVLVWLNSYLMARFLFQVVRATECLGACIRGWWSTYEWTPFSRTSSYRIALESEQPVRLEIQNRATNERVLSELT